MGVYRFIVTIDIDSIRIYAYKLALHFMNIKYGAS